MKFFSKYHIFILLLIYSCGNPNEKTVIENSKSLTEADSSKYNDAENQHINPPEVLPDSIQLILKKGIFVSKNNIDSLVVNESDWFYNVGINDNKYNYLVFIENFGKGSASGGVNISIIKKENGSYYKIQSLYAFFDVLKKTSTNNNYDISLYYPDALFDNNCPVSINYKWNGKYYEPDGIRYVTATTNINYSWDLLKKMGIVNDRDLLPSFPFVKINDKLIHYNINKIEVDTIVSKNKNAEKIFLFKNNCTDGIYSDHVWILKEQKEIYTLIGEGNKNKPEELKLLSHKKNEYPDILFGLDTLHWNGEAYKN